MGTIPICGSQINMPAKLYKRYTVTKDIKIKEDIVTYEHNTYRAYYSFAWVIDGDMQVSEYQPTEGAIGNMLYMNIKLYSNLDPNASDIIEPMPGDIVEVSGKIWMIDDGIRRVKNRYMRNVATVHLPLKRRI